MSQPETTSETYTFSNDFYNRDSLQNNLFRRDHALMDTTTSLTLTSNSYATVEDFEALEELLDDEIKKNSILNEDLKMANKNIKRLAQEIDTINNKITLLFEV